MISILLLDTIIDETEILREELHLLSAHNCDEQMQIISLNSAANLDETLNKLELLHAAFVDVTIPDGIESARELHSRYPELRIMVIADTGVSPLTYLTPAIRPLSLLLRPCSEEQRHQILEDFFFQAIMPLIVGDASFFWAKTRDGDQKIPYNSIIYFEAREKKVFVRTRKVEYGIGETIEALADKLPNFFLRCHRSYIINRNYLDRVRLSEGFLYLAGSLMVPVSRSYKTQVKEELNAGKSTGSVSFT